jgi:hypothetical protein
VEASDDGASWTEINRRKKKSTVNTPEAVKTSAVSQSGSFGRIQPCQTCPNHRGNSRLALSAFGLFGTVAGLPDDVAKFCFPMVPVFRHMGAAQRGHFVVRDGEMRRHRPRQKRRRDHAEQGLIWHPSKCRLSRERFVGPFED